MAAEQDRGELSLGTPIRQWGEEEGEQPPLKQASLCPICLAERKEPPGAAPAPQETIPGLYPPPAAPLQGISFPWLKYKQTNSTKCSAPILAGIGYIQPAPSPHGPQLPPALGQRQPQLPALAAELPRESATTQPLCSLPFATPSQEDALLEPDTVDSIAIPSHFPSNSEAKGTLRTRQRNPCLEPLAAAGHLAKATSSQHGLFLHSITPTARDHFLILAFLWCSLRQSCLALFLQTDPVLSSP